MVADYKYYFGSLRTPGVIAEIACYGIHMDMELNVGGTFNGTFQLDQTGKRNSDLLGATIPGYSFIMCERNGIVVWGGFVWSRTYQSQSKSVQLYGQTFEMYPNSQLIDTDLEAFDDIRNIFGFLWNTMQSTTERNLGINVTLVPPISELEIGLQAFAVDFKYYGEMMAQVANTSIGLDWYIRCSRTPNNDYRKDLIIGYPTVGTDLTSTSLIFEYPGSITNYYMTESMADAGTNIYVTGSGDGSNMIIGTATDPTLITQGFPRWDRVVSQKDIGSQFIANAWAEQQFAVRRPPKTTVKATMKGDLTPEFGAWGMGDTVKVVIKDARNPNGFEFPGRIVKWSLDPPTHESVEEYGLIFQNDEN